MEITKCSAWKVDKSTNAAKMTVEVTLNHQCDAVPHLSDVELFGKLIPEGTWDWEPVEFKQKLVTVSAGRAVFKVKGIALPNGNNDYVFRIRSSLGVGQFGEWTDVVIPVTSKY